MVDAAGSSAMMSKIMRPGMGLKDFSYQINSRDGNQGQVLVAKNAEIRDPANLMWIDGFAFRGGGGDRSYSVTAPEAVYDFMTGTLQTRGPFQGNALGMRFEGSRLTGEVKSRRFDFSDDFEIHLSSLVKPPPPAGDETWEELTCAPPSPFRPGRHLSGTEMTPIGQVQDFAGDLTTFLKCWSRVTEELVPNQTGIRRASDFMIMGRQGGQIDLGIFEMDLVGRTAILAPKSCLFSLGGIRIRETVVELERMMHLTGSGGIQAWMTPSASEKTLICSDKFEFVSDRRILQFEGGPLTLCRRGIILQASESWQFVRIFDGGRVVLSPGNWKTLGALATSD